MFSLFLFAAIEVRNVMHSIHLFYVFNGIEMIEVEAPLLLEENLNAKTTNNAIA